MRANILSAFALSVAAIASFFFSSCVKDIDVSGITLSKTSVELTEGESVSLSATVSPSDATDKTVTWSSGNPQVASVNEGVVSAIRAGSAVITARAGANSATCSVTVLAKIIYVSSISLDQTSLELYTGGSASLKATVSPDDATDKSVTWSSSDESVVLVSAEGVVSAKNQGEATVTCASVQVPSVTSSVKVKVLLPPNKVSVNDAPEVEYTDGQLSGVLSGTRVTKIVWTSDSSMNAEDVKALISAESALEYVDMSKVTIVGGGSYTYGDDYPATVSDNVLPTGLFFHCSSLKHIDLPRTITSIGNSAFYLTGLPSVVIPENVKSIGTTAFAECGALKSVTFPESELSLGQECFRHAGIVKLELDNVVFSGSSPFFLCLALTEAHLGKNIKTCQDVFGRCESLKNLTIDPENPNLKIEDKFIMSKDGKTVWNIVPGYSDINADFAVPAGTEKLYSMRYFSCASLTLPSTLKEIARESLQYVNIKDKTIRIPASVTKIGGQSISYSFNDADSSPVSVLYFDGTVPPALDGAICNNIVLTYIYVPEGCLDAYKKGFSSQSSLIPLLKEFSRGLFSVSASKKVRFSKGNLYWTGSGWAVEKHQYDYRTWPGKNSCIDGVKTLDGTPEGMVGQFFWNVSSELARAKEYVEDWTNTEDILFANKAEVIGENWVTLTGDEYDYLLKKRAYAADKAGFSTVGEVQGLILLPDLFTDPKKNGGSGEFAPFTDSSSYTWTANVYSLGADWDAMEAAGAVFLPAIGIRWVDAAVLYLGNSSYYWGADAKGPRYGQDLVAEYPCRLWRGSDALSHAKPIRLVEVVSGK